MNRYQLPPRDQWPTLCQRPQLQLDFLQSAVQNILSRVKKSGDGALLELARQYDKAELTSLVVTEAELTAAEQQLWPSLKAAILTAAANIETFHKQQQRGVEQIETMPGVFCWRKGVPIQKVGLYIPGGSAPLFSTVLMLGVPARLAGCQQVILCTPPDAKGAVHPAILFAAKSVGITQIFKAGGAQAIAAMAYGTASIPAVYKIFGPGNQYVTKAKQMVNLEGIAIDMPAGPSEVLVVADETANASFVAADLLSQAEHGEDSQVMLVASSASVVEKIVAEVERQVVSLPRKEIAQAALKNSRAVILNPNDVIDFVNTYAPEHLILNTRDCEALAEQVVNAGSVFIGPYSPESAGDYASGTNHTLPTNGTATCYGGVSLDSFLKYITYQRLTEQGLANLGPVVEEMAEAEQLRAHAQAVRVRTSSLR